MTPVWKRRATNAVAEWKCTGNRPGPRTRSIPTGSSVPERGEVSVDDPRVFKIGEHVGGKRRAAARKRWRAEQLEALAEGAIEHGREERFDQIMDAAEELRERADKLER